MRKAPQLSGVPIGQAHVRAAAARRPVPVAIGRGHPTREVARPTGPCRPVLVVPIWNADQSHGALVLVDRLGALGFGTDERDLAATLAAQPAVILDNAVPAALAAGLGAA